MNTERNTVVKMKKQQETAARDLELLRSEKEKVVQQLQTVQKQLDDTNASTLIEEKSQKNEKEMESKVTRYVEDNDKLRNDLKQLQSMLEAKDAALDSKETAIQTYGKFVKYSVV